MIVTRIVCAIVVVTACLVLAGWSFDVPALRRFGGPVSMNPATALSLFAAGLSLALLAADTRRGRTPGMLLAALVVVAGGVHVLGYLLGRQIGFDDLLFPERLSDDGTPNRMALNTAIGFTLAGLALLFLDVETRRRHRPAEPIAAVVGLLALLALTGHAYDVPTLSRVAATAIPMAIVTAIAFLALTVGILAARPGSGWMAVLTGDHAGGALARRVLPLVIGLPLVLGFALLEGRRAGMYGTSTGFAAFAVANLVVPGLLILLTARSLGRSDLARRAAHEAEQRLRSELKAASDAGVAVAEAVATAERTDGGVVLQAIADHARTVAHARYAVIAFGTDPARPFSPYAQSGMSRAEIAAIGREPHPVGARGLAAREGEVVRVPDVRDHPAFAGYPRNHPEITSVLAVPVRYRGRSFGTLYLGEKIGASEFTIEDERALVLLAAHAGVALENARLYRDALLDRSRLEAVLEQLPEGVVVRDARGDVVLCNRIARGLSRHVDDALLNVRSPTGEPIPPGAHPVERALRHGETVVGMEGVLHDGPQPIPVLVNAAPIRDAEGALAGAVTVFQDITGRQELERMREEWSAVIAHDLRQPVSVIRFGASFLERRLATSPDLADARQAAARIAVAAQRLTVMIGDLLDVSRLEANRLDIRREPVDVAALARDVVERSVALDPEHAVRLETRGTSAVASVDPSRIDQVLGNLLSNAAKYGDAGAEILVVVEGRAGELDVSVTNRGPGIPPDGRARLFTRFYRAAAAAASGRDGIGLGLYLCKGLVEAHGGTIHAESVPGERTTFRFTIPKAEAAFR